MKGKKTKLPSDESIEQNRNTLKDIVNKVVSGELIMETKKETVSAKLDLIKEELLVFKDKGVSYRIIAKVLYDHLGLKVNEQTLRTYCQERLGFSKRKALENKSDDSFQTQPEELCKQHENSINKSANSVLTDGEIQFK